MLNVKLLDLGAPKPLLALSLDPPDLSRLESTILLLREAGALSNRSDDTYDPLDGTLTSLGKLMASLPVNINIARLIALGYVFGVLRSATIIGAAMTTKSVFSNPFQKKLKAYRYYFCFSVLSILYFCIFCFVFCSISFLFSVFYSIILNFLFLYILLFLFCLF